MRWASAETLKPGANSRVRAPPPNCASASSTSTLRPDLAEQCGSDQAIVAAADDDGVK